MDKLALTAWVLTALFVVAALVAVIVQPTHWHRTLALAAVLAIVSAGLGFYRLKAAKQAA